MTESTDSYRLFSRARRRRHQRSFRRKSELFSKNLLWLCLAAGNSYTFEHHMLFGSLYMRSCEANFGENRNRARKSFFLEKSGSESGSVFKILESVGIGIGIGHERRPALVRSTKGGG